jgi:hypothetical protein
MQFDEQSEPSGCRFVIAVCNFRHDPVEEMTVWVMRPARQGIHQAFTSIQPRFFTRLDGPAGVWFLRLGNWRAWRYRSEYEQQPNTGDENDERKGDSHGRPPLRHSHNNYLSYQTL